MGQGQPRRPVAAFSDPFAGEPLRGDAKSPEVFSDPYAGEPLRVATKGENLPEEKPPTWADQLGLNRPTDSMIMGFNRGFGGAAVDLLQGAVANVVNRVGRGGDPKLREILNAPPVAETADAMQAPDNFAGQMGGLVPTVAEMAIPGPGVVKGGKAAVGLIPNAARAGEKFQEVMGAAKNIPIDVKDVGDAALRIQQLADRGGSMPLAVRKLLNRLTDPNKAAMTYEESRDFASNISRLSINEFGRLTPNVAREVANLRVTLNQANAKAAELAGKGAEYKSAMREYAQAMKLRDAVDAAIKGAKKSLPIATAAGAGYWLTRQIRSALGGGE